MIKYLLNLIKISILIKRNWIIMNQYLIMIILKVKTKKFKKLGLKKILIFFKFKKRWKPGEVLGHGSFGKVILGFNKDTG